MLIVQSGTCPLSNPIGEGFGEEEPFPLVSGKEEIHTCLKCYRSWRCNLVYECKFWIRSVPQENIITNSNIRDRIR